MKFLASLVLTHKRVGVLLLVEVAERMVDAPVIRLISLVMLVSYETAVYRAVCIYSPECRG